MLRPVTTAVPEEAPERTFSLPEEMVTYPAREVLSAAFAVMVRQANSKMVKDNRINNLRIGFTSFVLGWHICRPIIPYRQADENRPNPGS